jgi:hypothetical protein
MSERAKQLIVVLTVITASLSTGVLSELREAAFVMECCAKAKYECAGVGTPDDCCRRMHHTSDASSPSIIRPSNAAAHDVAIVMPAIEVIAVIVTDRPVSAPDFKRPHDPPHLHTFSLLI